MVGMRTASLVRVWGYILRRWYRQRETANPAIRIGQLNVKRIFAYSATLAGFAVFVKAFFPFFP